MANPTEKSKEIHARLQGLRKTALRGTPAVDGRAAPYFEEDPRDEYFETKKQIVADNNYFNLGTEVPITSKDIQYIQDQKTKEEKLLFDKWKWQTFQPGSDPQRIEYFEKIDPSWFAEREAEIDKILAFTEKLALLVLNGPQDEDDVILLYGISTGKIPIPNWKAVYQTRTTDVDDATIVQGYFNPTRYVSSDPQSHVPSLYTSTVLNPKPLGNEADVLFGRNRVGEWKTKFQNLNANQNQ